MAPLAILTTAASGFGVAFLHAAIPVHWLPFVLAGRAQGWTWMRTLGVTLLAGGAHVAVTAVLGLLATVLGITLGHYLEEQLPRVVAVVLVLFALYAFRRQSRAGTQHCHGHDRVVARRGDRAVATGLVLMLLVSPCEAFIPVYVAGVPFGWAGFAVLTSVFALATLGAMTLFVVLAWRGLAAPKLVFLQRWEWAIVGFVLLLAAVLLLLY